MKVILIGLLFKLLKKTGYCSLFEKHCVFKQGVNRCGLLAKRRDLAKEE